MSSSAINTIQFRSNIIFFIYPVLSFFHINCTYKIPIWNFVFLATWVIPEYIILGWYPSMIHRRIIYTKDVELLEQDLPGLPSQIRRPWRRSEGRSSWWTSWTTSSPGLGSWSTYGPWWSPGWPEAQQHYVGTLHCQLVLIRCAGGNFVKTNSWEPGGGDGLSLCILSNLYCQYYHESDYTVHAIGFNSSWDHTKERKEKLQTGLFFRFISKPTRLERYMWGNFTQ